MIYLIHGGIEHVDERTDQFILQLKFGAIVQFKLSNGLHYPTLNADCLQFDIVGCHD
jgi:hypothetical protein